MNTPLRDADYDKLEFILNQFNDKNVMNLEAVDGFFTALICSPELIPPSVYLKEIWGKEERPVNPAITSTQDMQDFMGLLMRHWNAVQARLSDDDVFIPLLIGDADDNVFGNNWANGFLQGVKLDHANWTELFDDEDNGGSLVAIMALAHEHDPDPEMRPYKEPVSEKLREELIVHLSIGAMQIYNYFEPHRRMAVSDMRDSNTFRRNTPKVGRNDPCPCGSGRKFKKCCGEVTLDRNQEMNRKD